MPLTWRQIEAFRAVMITGAVIRAAEMLRISQPSVSRLIADMEHDLDYALFNRERGRLRPTEMAEALFVEVERAFVGRDDVEAVARAIGLQQLGSLRIVSMASTANDLLADTLAEFSSAHPKVQISLEVRPRRRVIEWIASQQYDLGICRLPIDDPDITVTELATFDLVCILPRGHLLASNRIVRAGDLQGESYISLPRDSDLRRHIDTLFDEQGVERRIHLETRNSDTIIKLVSAGAGVSIISAYRLLGETFPGLEVRPFLPKVSDGLGLLAPAHRPMSAMTKEFGALLHRAYRGVKVGNSR